MSQEKQMPLADQVLFTLSRIAQRSDVILEKRRTAIWSGPINKWESILPPDMFEFYKTYNGLWFRWNFMDDPNGCHGPRLHGLERDGKKLINPTNNGYVLGLTQASRFPSLQPSTTDPIDPTERLLLFDGEDSGYGTLMRILPDNTYKFGWWNNDGFTQTMTTSFTELIHIGLESGFGYMWQWPGHPEVEQVKKRLTTPVPLRETFTVEVLERREVSASEYRQKHGAALVESRFEAVMQALGQPMTAANMSPQQRGQCFDAALSAKGLTTKTLKAAAKVYGWKDPQDLTNYYRLHNRPLVEVSLTFTWLNTPGSLPLAIGTLTLERILHSIEELKVSSTFPADPNYLSYTNIARYRIYWSAGTWEQISNWAGQSTKSCTYRLSLESEQALHLETGRSFTSTALPAILDEIQYV